jgi:hypothetical protein
MVSEAEMEAFYTGKRCNALPLAVNDVVTVLAGRKPGERAWVISLHESQPGPSYLIEYEDGSDETVSLANLKAQ